MNYTIIITETYRKKVIKFSRKHPEMIPTYAKVLSILETNPYHPSLRLHKLQGKLHEYYSISLDTQYRMLIVLNIDESTIIPIDIGTHDERY